MFVLRVSKEEIKMLEVVLDYYLSDLPHVDFYDLKDKVKGAEYYNDRDFSIVLNKTDKAPN